MHTDAQHKTILIFKHVDGKHRTRLDNTQYGTELDNTNITCAQPMARVQVGDQPDTNAHSLNQMVLFYKIPPHARRRARVPSATLSNLPTHMRTPTISSRYQELIPELTSTSRQIRIACVQLLGLQVKIIFCASLLGLPTRLHGLALAFVAKKWIYSALPRALSCSFTVCWFFDHFEGPSWAASGIQHSRVASPGPATFIFFILCRHVVIILRGLRSQSSWRPSATAACCVTAF